MPEPNLVNRRLRELFGVLRPRWRSIAERVAIPFLSGGVLLLVTAALVAVDALTAVSTQGVLTGVTSFLGIILSYVGLLALYPWYADRSPRLARAGFGLVALPTIVVTGLLLWGVAYHVPFGAVPSPIDSAPVGPIFMTTFLLFALGVGVFGIVSLQTRVPSPHVGLYLLGLAMIWIGLLAASSLYGSKLPAWLDFISLGLMASCSLAIGYSLRAGPQLDEHTEHVPDSTP